MYKSVASTFSTQIKECNFLNKLNDIEYSIEDALEDTIISEEEADDLWSELESKRDELIDRYCYDISKEMIEHNLKENFSLNEIKEMIKNRDSFIWDKLAAHEHSEMFEDEDEMKSFCEQNSPIIFKYLNENIEEYEDNDEDDSENNHLLEWAFEVEDEDGNSFECNTLEELKNLSKEIKIFKIAVWDEGGTKNVFDNLKEVEDFLYDYEEWINEYEVNDSKDLYEVYKIHVESGDPIDCFGKFDTLKEAIEEAKDWDGCICIYKGDKCVWSNDPDVSIDDSWLSEEFKKQDKNNWLFDKVKTLVEEGVILDEQLELITGDEYTLGEARFDCKNNPAKVARLLIEYEVITPDMLEDVFVEDGAPGDVQIDEILEEEPEIEIEEVNHHVGKWTMREIDGVKMSVKEFLQELDADNLPYVDAIYPAEGGSKISLEELKSKYIDNMGEFYIYEDDDGYDDHYGPIIIKYLWFEVLNEKAVNDTKKKLTKDAKQYIYQFPKDMTKEDLAGLSKFNLKLLGKVSEDGFQPGDYVVQGSLKDLEEYCDKWLGYVMHEDYLYEKENFAEEVIDKVN